MKQVRNIESEIEKTLQSLDTFTKVRSDAFFYTRLKARMDNPKEALFIRWFFETPYLKPALLVLFLSINILTLVSWLNTNAIQNQATTTVTDSFIEEYDLNSLSDTFLVLNEE
jgi:hypothetical protein